MYKRQALAEAQAAQAHHEALLAWAAENPVVVTVPRPVRTLSLIHISEPTRPY